MPVKTIAIQLETRGNADIQDITNQVAEAVLRSRYAVALPHRMVDQVIGDDRLRIREAPLDG